MSPNRYDSFPVGGRAGMGARSSFGQHCFVAGRAFFYWIPDLNEHC
jgi:hypothetical protein